MKIGRINVTVLGAVCATFGLMLAVFGACTIVASLLAPTGISTIDYVVRMNGGTYLALGIATILGCLNKTTLACAIVLVAAICILDAGGVIINLFSRSHHLSFWWPTIYDAVT